ncbi:MAG: IS1595 family transposase, partial [Saprospiraceae bacterium]
MREEGRKARKRGSDRKTRGIGNEQVCVLTAMTRSDDFFLRVVKRGRLDSASVEREFSHRIRKRSVNRTILVTDSHNAYEGIVREKNLIHKKIPSRKHLTPDGFHIQQVNALHQRLDKGMRQFNGVASKYLQNYMNYFAILEKTKNLRERFLRIWERILLNKAAFFP